MSISRLSNHLYVIVTTIISLLIAPSTFHQARASDVSHDFTESRQFKKNLAVSKYRENPHWLSNYTWKPPEKFYGTRKGPTWEMERVNESMVNRKEQEELETWEKKMRDVSNREREKWKTYETEKSQSNDISDYSTSNSPSKVTNETLSNREREKEVSTEKIINVRDTLTESSVSWNKDILNGRWGMSGSKPTVEEFFNDSSRLLEKTKLASERGKGKAVGQPTMISNGRWGMSVKEAPKELTNQLSRRFQARKSLGRVWKQDQDRKSTGKRKIHDGSEVTVKEVSVTVEPVATKLPKVFPNGRWGMSSDLPPREFLREISRRGLPGIPGFYKSKNVLQREQKYVKNKPRPRRLMFSQMPGISNIVFLQPLTIGLPILPRYLTMDPRIRPSLPNYNVAIFSFVISRNEFL